MCPPRSVGLMDNISVTNVVPEATVAERPAQAAWALRSKRAGDDDGKGMPDDHAEQQSAGSSAGAICTKMRSSCVAIPYLKKKLLAFEP